MRIILATLAKCWIMIQTPSPKEPSDLDSDDGGPLRKYRKLTLDQWTAASATMDRVKKDQQHQGTRGRSAGAGPQTRDVGVLCSERVPVNDKCIMVGTTGIAALKAKYGDDFTNFEIIQDVGYSSESSTHLSGDDTGLDHPFNVRIYKYTSDNQPTPQSLREELESACLRNLHSLGSSLESSSSAAASFDDSGLGAGEALTAGDSGGDVLLGQLRTDEDYEQEELDYLETVLDECVDFGVNAGSDPEELHFNLSGLDSDDPSDTFHNRSSFTTSAQVFYKMTSVDSDNGEADNNNNEDTNNNAGEDTNKNLSSSTLVTSSNTTLDASNNSVIAQCQDLSYENKSVTSDSDPETFKPVHPPATTERPKPSHRAHCSTPRSDRKSFCRHQSLKRKRGHQDVLDVSRMSSRIRSWLTCSDFSSSLRRRSPDVFRGEDLSSCDASCECTSSSADESNAGSSSRSSSFFDDDVFRLVKSRLDSVQGSVETVVHHQALPDSPELFLLLPPPPSSTASFGSGSKIFSATEFGRVRKQGKRPKACSDGDIEKRKSPKEISDSPGRQLFQKLLLSKAAINSRLYSSLPTVLRASSDSSTDDNCLTSTLPSSHSDVRTTGCANHSSSSEISRRRRRSRKKSSSSNRSSTSVLVSGCDSSGRHRTGTSSTSRCGSRRRHRSQKSEFVCPDVVSSDEGKSPLKVEIPPVEENAGFEELCRASSALMSPTESDIVLTRLEEQSTVSDQVWDGYQEMPYLSEGYSEATVDEDAVRKLTEFGDDYGSAIGQPVRLMDNTSVENNKADCSSKPAKKCAKSVPIAARLPRLSHDSDSDSEDLYYVIEEAGKALNFAQIILRRKQAGDALTSADYAELLATCGTHLRCLQSICAHINGQEHNFSAIHLKQLHDLIEQWQELQRNTEMFEKSEDPARHKYLKAQENIDALFNTMSRLASCSYLELASLASWEDVDKNMSRLQVVLTSLQEAKEQLLSVNLQVHRFTTEYGGLDTYKDCTLKDDITELYRQWEDTYEQNGAHLTELQTLKTDWEVYNEKFRSLRVRVKEAELGYNEDSCDTAVVSTTEVEGDSLLKDLEDLERCSARLKSRLKGGDAWKTIQEELRGLRSKIRGEEKSSHRASSPSVNHRIPSSRAEEDVDDHFEDAIQQLCANADPSAHTPLPSGPPKKKGRRGAGGRFWRIIRIAVPVQFALVLLYCLACYLEPSCCNALNNFNFSFTPQLRYFGGRPPV